MNRIIPIFLVTVTLSVAMAGSLEDAKIETERLSERVLVLNANYRACRVIALATEKGIVVIDTGRSPSLAANYREAIEKAFGRSDFTWVINTHTHYDHIGGNQIFPEATVIAHETGVQDVEELAATLPQFTDNLKKRLIRLQKFADQLESGSTQQIRMRQFIELDEWAVRDMENDYVPVPAHVTFNDRMSLNLGDITIEMFYFGPAHSISDVVVRVPEEKLVAVGHLFPEGLLGIARPGNTIDVPRWLDVLGEIMADGGISHLVESHRSMSLEELQAIHRYIADLWSSVVSYKEQGKTIDQALEKLGLRERFGFLSPYFDFAQQHVQLAHENNTRMFWGQLTENGVEQISEALEKEDGVSRARKLFMEMRKDKEGRYYLGEAAMNQLGYRFLGERRFPEAIAVFKMNVELHPESWNVHDSLGEAYVAAGDKELGIKSYEKALQLNPDNENGKQALENLR